MWLIAVFAIGTIVQSTPDFNFTKVGYVTFSDGSEMMCLNDCVDNRCIFDTSWVYYPCESTEKLAPTSYTYKRRSLEEKCLSRCDHIGTKYSWCYVSQDGSWDFCNSNSTLHWKRKVKLTYHNGPCLDDCQQRCPDRNCPYTCNHYFGTWDFCYNSSFDYIEGRTFFDDPCRSTCEYHDKRSYRWCYFGRHKMWDRCALPTQPGKPSWSSRIQPFLKYTKPIKLRNQPWDFFDSEGNDLVSILEADLENDPRYQTAYVEDADNPVLRYTFEGRVEGKPLLPKVVKAEVTSKHVCGKNLKNLSYKVVLNLGLMGKTAVDHVNTLIPVYLSGPYEEYNFVPQNDEVFESSLEEGIFIKTFLTDNADANAKVQITVIIIYDKDTDVRPSMFIEHKKLYLNEELVDQYYNVLPNS